MLVSCWSTKGGAGTTVVACALALQLARAAPGGALLLDLAGDVPCALGLPDGDGRPGIAEWLGAAPDVASDGLRRLEEPAGERLAVVRRGGVPPPATHAELLCGLVSAEPRPVVVDCGRLEVGASGAALAFAAGAGRSLLVLRPCFLAVHRARRAPVRPSGVVLVSEPGRALRAADVEDHLGVPVVARVRVSDQVARAVDAGLLTARLPRSLTRDLRHAA